MSRQIQWKMEPISSEPSKSQMDLWNAQILSALIHAMVGIEVRSRSRMHHERRSI